MPTTEVVVVTGMSGAGKSTALRALEDLGFYCCDNLPSQFSSEMVTLCERAGIREIALGLDARLGDFLRHVDSVIGELKESRKLHVLFFDAAEESLIRRFSETRRPHPLAKGGDVLTGIRMERALLAPLRARATRTIDTTGFNVHELRQTLTNHFAEGRGPQMTTRVVSFGFKFGAPVDADLVFDVRFLPNPYFVPALKGFSGKHEAVAEFVLAAKESREFVQKVLEILRFSLPLYAREGKAYLTIAIGCTGGMHRSVAISEEIGRLLRESGFDNIVISHRDLERHQPPE